MCAGFRHNISTSWRGSEPSSPDFDNCAEYVVRFMEHGSTSSGLNDIPCDIRELGARLLCRHPPTSIRVYGSLKYTRKTGSVDSLSAASTTARLVSTPDARSFSSGSLVPETTTHTTSRQVRTSYAFFLNGVSSFKSTKSFYFCKTN